MPIISSTSTTPTPPLSTAATSLNGNTSAAQKQQQVASTSNGLHMKLSQQSSLPIQLQYKQATSPLYSQHVNVTTMQPSPAGTFMTQSAGIINSSVHGSMLMNGNLISATGGDISPISSTGSFSSADTNQTQLNAIIGQQQQRQQHSLPATPINRSNANSRSFRTKYGQFMIITPAVSIDRGSEDESAAQETNLNGNISNFTRTNSGRRTNNNTNNLQSKTTITTATTTTTTGTNTLSVPNTPITKTSIHRSSENVTNNKTRHNNAELDIDDMSSYFNNGNVFRMSLLQSSIDSGCSSDSSSFRSNYNPYIHTSRSHLLPKSAPQNFYTFSSWRWCTLICAAMRCFGGGHHSTHTSYSSSFARPPYQRTRSHGHSASTRTKTKTPHRRLRPSSSFTAETAFEHFSAPFTPRKTRDHLNNITYEL